MAGGRARQRRRLGRRGPSRRHARCWARWAARKPNRPGTLGIKSLLEGLLLPLEVLGADTPQAKRDFASWTGSAGVFASGSSLLELKAGISIDSKDPSASQAAVPKLAAALHARGAQLTPATVPGAEAAQGARISGLPLELVIAAGRDSSGQAKLVIGLGEASAAQALSPSSTLGNSPSHQAAETTLGEQHPAERDARLPDAAQPARRDRPDPGPDACAGAAVSALGDDARRRRLTSSPAKSTATGSFSG